MTKALSFDSSTSKEIKDVLIPQLQATYKRDYSILRGMKVPIPQGNLTLGTADQLYVAIQKARAFSDTAGAIELKWLRYYNAADNAHNRDKEALAARIQKLIRDNPDMIKKCTSMAAKQAAVSHLASGLQLRVEALRQACHQLKAFRDETKRAHAIIRDSQKDVLTATGLLKVLASTGNLRPEISGGKEPTDLGEEIDPLDVETDAVEDYIGG